MVPEEQILVPDGKQRCGNIAFQNQNKPWFAESYQILSEKWSSTTLLNIPFYYIKSEQKTLQ